MDTPVDIPKDLAARLDLFDERLRRVEAHLALPNVSDTIGRARSESAPPAGPKFIPAVPDAPDVAASVPHVAAVERPVRLPRVSDTSGRRTEEKKKTSIDYERFVGVAVLGRVGIAAVLLAAGYFGQLGWREIGPWARVATIYGLASIFITVGAVLRTKVSRLFLSLLWGGGAAAMYLAGVLAKLHFGLVGPTAALAMLFASCAVAQFLAYKVRFEVLAITALVGAFAAPVLVGSPADNGTALMIYVLALHGWGAFTQARFGWKGARFVGIVGTLVVGGLWLRSAGHMDVFTYVHIQAYIFGLTLPEWSRAVLGRAMPVARAGLLFGLAFFLELAAFAPPGLIVAFGGRLGLLLTHDILANLMPLTALAWTALAIVARARENAPTPVTTALARVAIAMILPAVWMVFRGRGLEMDDVRTLALASLAVVAALLVVFRARFGLRDGGPLAASVLPIFTLGAIGHPDLRIGLALVPAAALVGWGRSAATRSLGYVAGVLSIVVGFSGATSASWAAAGFGAFALWATAARETRRFHDSDGLRQVVDFSLLLSVAVWSVLSLVEGPFVAVATPFANAGTVAALLLAVALVVRAPWRADQPRPLQTAGFAVASLVALVGLSAWRELHAALSAHAAYDTQIAVETFFFCTCAIAALALSRKTGVRTFSALAIGLLAFGHIHAFESLGIVAGSPWWILGEIVALSATAWALGAGSPTGRVEERVASAIGILASASLWLAADAAHRLGASPLIVNPRFIAGVAVAAALALVRFQSARGLPRGMVVIVGIASALVGFEAGRREVVDAVTALDSRPWQDALGSIYTAVFASAVLALGFARRAADLRWLALVGFGLLGFKVALHDLANVSTPLRILITGCFGVILLLAAYAYARGRRSDAPIEPAVPPTPPEPPAS